MDGPALIHAAWLLCLVWIWAYRRYFEKVADPSAELEAFCRSRPVLAALAVKKGADAVVASALGTALGERAELVATLGVWPWPHHALEVDIRTAPGVVTLSIDECRVLRTRERALPALTTTLLAAIEHSRDEVVDTWIHPEAYTDGTGRIPSSAGWRLAAPDNVRRPCEPRDVPAPLVARCFERAQRETGAAARRAGSGEHRPVTASC